MIRPWRPWAGGGKPVPMRLRLRGPALSAALTLTLITGCSSGSDMPTTGPTATQTALTLGPYTVECASIESGYDAWDGSEWLPSAADDVVRWDGVTADLVVRDGEKLFAKVEGWKSQPAKGLAVVVAEYNMAVALVNLQLSALPARGTETGVTHENAQAVIDGVVKIRQTYREYMAEICT